MPPTTVAMMVLGTMAIVGPAAAEPFEDACASAAHAADQVEGALRARHHEAIGSNPDAQLLRGLTQPKVGLPSCPTSIRVENLPHYAPITHIEETTLDLGKKLVLPPVQVPPIEEDKCSFKEHKGSANLKYYTTERPFGTAGYTGPHGNNYYFDFVICLSTWQHVHPDGRVVRYMFVVYRASLNAGTDNHVASYYDFGTDTTERLWVTVGSGEAIEDVDPWTSISVNPSCVELQLGVSKIVSASLKWEMCASDADIYNTYWSGSTGKWKTEENCSSLPCLPNFKTTYGWVQEVPVDTYAEINWNNQAWFHHYKWCCTSHLHILNTWGTEYVWVPKL